MIFISHVLFTSVGALFAVLLCTKKKSEAKKINPTISSAKSTPSMNPQFTTSSKQESSSSENTTKEEKKDDGPIVLDTSLPAVQFLLTKKGHLDEEWLQNLWNLEEKITVYIWSMNKRFDADANSWKELGRKITKLRSEGFFVTAGSEEAKNIRKKEEVQNNVANEIYRIKASKVGSKQTKSKKER